MGFEYYGIWEIIEDILFNNKPYLMDSKIFEKTFKLIRSTAGKTYLPIYKYLKGLDRQKDTIPADWCIINDLDDIALNSNEKNYTKDNKIYTSIDQILSDYPDYYPKQLSYIMLSKNYIGTEDLGDFLRRGFKNDDIKAKFASQVKKLVAIYDFKKYS